MGKVPMYSYENKTFLYLNDSVVVFLKYWYNDGHGWHMAGPCRKFQILPKYLKFPSYCNAGEFAVHENSIWDISIGQKLKKLIQNRGT